MRRFLALTALAAGTALLAALPARAAEATFTRTLTVNGRPELTVATGSGSIHLKAGPAGQIHVTGHVRSSWGGGTAEVQQVVAHPPIEQTGNIVRIGTHASNLRHVSIDYEVEAPADAYLDASTGSGNVQDEGVGASARLATGSGNIHATGLRGGFTAETGSGSIYAEQISAGDVRAQTGSGSIELRNLNGALRAETGSGSIKAGGTPAGPWKLETGSGGVEVWTGNASFSLNAEAGSGSIQVDRSMSEQHADHHHVRARIGSGGPELRIATGSGDIRVH